jgi:hypothetical protein
MERLIKSNAYAEQSARAFVPPSDEPIYRTGSRSLMPPRQDRRGIGCLDLRAKTGVIEAQQHVVSLVWRAAHGIAHDDHTVTKVNRA